MLYHTCEANLDEYEIYKWNDICWYLKVDGIDVLIYTCPFCSKRL